MVAVVVAMDVTVKYALVMNVVVGIAVAMVVVNGGNIGGW